MFLENHLRMHLWHPLISHISNAIYTLITFIGHPPSMCTLNPLLHRLLQTYCSISSLSTSLMSTYCANAMCLNLMSYINRLTRTELSRTLLTSTLVHADTNYFYEQTSLIWYRQSLLTLAVTLYQVMWSNIMFDWKCSSRASGMPCGHLCKPFFCTYRSHQPSSPGEDSHKVPRWNSGVSRVINNWIRTVQSLKRCHSVVCVWLQTLHGEQEWKSVLYFSNGMSQRSSSTFHDFQKYSADLQDQYGNICWNAVTSNFTGKRILKIALSLPRI